MLPSMVAAEQGSQERVARRAVIIGRVQGVFFRDSARQQARMLNVKGWVRNRADGSVEVWAEGERAAVGALFDWCREGPSRASVETVLIEDAEPAWHDTFQVR